MTLLPCKIFPGGFSGEFTFKVNLDDGIEHVGLAARQYFWDKASGQPVQQPSAKGVDGYVVVRILKKLGDHNILVSIPDGEVLKLDKSLIISIPERLHHVPVGS